MTHPQDAQFKKRDALRKDALQLADILRDAYTTEALKDAFIDAETTAFSILKTLYSDEETIKLQLKEYFSS